MDNQNITQDQPTPGLSNKSTESHRSKTLIFIFLTLIIATTAFMVAYFWQKSKHDITNNKLNDASTKINSLQRQLSTKPETTERTAQKIESSASTTTNPDLIPGDTDTKRSDGRILITAAFKYSLEPSAVWIEYGKDPSNLNKSTTKYTKGLGLGDPTAVYAQGISLAISNSELEPGTVYYYRVAATVKDQTQRSAIASFVTDK